MLILCDSMGYAMVTSGKMVITKQADLMALAAAGLPLMLCRVQFLNGDRGVMSNYAC